MAMHKRKIFSALVALLITQTSSALECSKQQTHSATTYVMVDRSDPPANAEGLNQTLRTVGDAIRPSERLVIGLAGAKLSDARVIMDLVRPEQTMWESAIKIRAKEKEFHDCLEMAKTEILASNASQKSSAILETLSFVGDIMRGDSVNSRRVVVYSDMVQNTESLSFIGQVNVDGAIKMVEKDKLLWDLKGIDISVAGIGGEKSLKHAKQVEEFWRKYFEKSGATLKFYGPMLLSLS